jgi:integrase
MTGKTNIVLLDHKRYDLLFYGQVGIMLELQRRFGLRYCEVAGLTPQDIIDDQYLFFRGKKGSNSRIVYAPDLIADIRKHLAGRNTGLVFTVTYKQYFKFCAKHVPENRVRKNGNRRVTHWFRAKIIQSFKNVATLQDRDVQGFTGQKSKKSLLYYLREYKR